MGEDGRDQMRGPEVLARKKPVPRTQHSLAAAGAAAQHTVALLWVQMFLLLNILSFFLPACLPLGPLAV